MMEEPAERDTAGAVFREFAGALVILFFDTDDDYRRGDEALNAMPAGDTPGKRASVTKYDVAFRMTD